VTVTQEAARTRCAWKFWEIIADNLSKAGWSWGGVAALDREGRTIWIADAHRDDGKRFVLRADERVGFFWNPRICDSHFARRRNMLLRAKVVKVEWQCDTGMRQAAAACLFSLFC
jgi:hypothetical protein